jgi:GDPmannose 4,6-dehydratase
MWLILQQESPDDFVCATGISHTVRELVEYVFEKIGLDWRPYVRIDTKYFRPEELEDLKGDSTKLRKSTGWEPTYTFESMLDEMIEYWMLHYQA